MSLLYSFVMKRIGNRICWEDKNGLYQGNLSSVEQIEDGLLLGITEISDLTGDYWNGGAYLPNELITVSSELNEESVRGDGTINLTPLVDSYEKMVLRPYKHYQKFDEIGFW